MMATTNEPEGITSVRWRRLGAAALAGLLVVLTAREARAADSDPEKLFVEGSALIEQGRCSEALPLLTQAQALDPGIGTQFNIAVCQEQLGRLGSAWRNFEQVAQLARASGKKQREDAARARLGALRSRVPTLRIRSEEPGDVTVKVDGVVVRAQEWSFIPVDGGSHRIDASAPTKTSWSHTVDAPAEGGALEIVVPNLPIVQRTQVVRVTESPNKRRTVGFILGGVGVAAAGAAAVTGIMLLGAKSTADQRCTPRCLDANGALDQEGVDAVKRGQTLLPINAVAWGVAAVGLGVGTFLILTAPSPEPKVVAKRPSSSWEATLGPRGGTLRLRF